MKKLRWLGILPLVFATGAGAHSRHSLGTAVCGGMVISTVLSLYIVPVIYLTVRNITEFFGRKGGKKGKIYAQPADSEAESKSRTNHQDKTQLDEEREPEKSEPV